jgi:hypothetical protein
MDDDLIVLTVCSKKKEGEEEGQGGQDLYFVNGF